VEDAAGLSGASSLNDAYEIVDVHETPCSAA
jgi:hypothetical protein